MANVPSSESVGLLKTAEFFGVAVALAFIGAFVVALPHALHQPAGAKLVRLHPMLFFVSRSRSGARDEPFAERIALPRRK
jgi:hypothetical protein